MPPTDRPPEAVLRHRHTKTRVLKNTTIPFATVSVVFSVALFRSALPLLCWFGAVRAVISVVRS